MRKYANLNKESSSSENVSEGNKMGKVLDVNSIDFGGELVLQSPLTIAPSM